MEQIYYTQCPVGYGLGASNGFQVKRLSPKYPMSGDFRHLGMKAFPGGARTLAPPCLRYRKEGELAEVAWLTPRTHEYETERGLWGRPGGHFAHGLRLSLDELKPIKRWPAGLFDGSCWKRADREPSRGRPPDGIELGESSLLRSPTFADVAPLAEGFEPDLLARLLTALAIVTREGRTLFLIDEPARLGPLVALLTFAFPEKLRDELTFSTYHDRPEELPGYRLSGTIPLARPNKPALNAQGIVADLILGSFEPRIEPTAWARTLADWLLRHDPIDEADWSATDQRARSARTPTPSNAVWSDEWLGHAHAYPAAQREKSSPTDGPGWQSLADFTTWLGHTGLGAEWVRRRNATWWRDAANLGKTIPEARAALLAHATLRETWRNEPQPSAWGDIVATWFRDADPTERDESIAAVLQAAPKSSRPSFARALLRGLTPSGAEAVLDRLRADPSADRAMLLPLEASAAVTAILMGADPTIIRSIVEDSLGLPGATAGVLDAVEACLLDHEESRASLAAHVSAAFDLEAGGGQDGLIWALRRGDEAADWLAPALRPVFADLNRQELWQALHDRTPEELLPELARTALALTADPGLPDEAFRWAVESLLLPLAPRPSNPTWAETYLKRTPSDLDLYDRLIDPRYRKLRVFEWLKEANGRGDLTKVALSRISTCLDFHRVRKSKDASSLRSVRLPDVPPDQRGSLFEQMLDDLAGSSLEGLMFVLDAARQAWPGAFVPGAAGLRSVADPLARCLSNLQMNGSAWLARLGLILERLGLIQGELRGFEPDGLAAEIAGAAPRLAGATFDPWPLRKALFNDGSWRILAVDIQRALSELPPRRASEVFQVWDNKVPMNQAHPARLYELFLNSCDGPRLVHAIIGRLPDLKTYPRIAWWNHRQRPGALDDLRDGFARVAPMGPLPIGQPFLRPAGQAGFDSDSSPARLSETNMSTLKRWVEGSLQVEASSDEWAPIALDAAPESARGSLRVGLEDAGRPSHLSPEGLARWRCLQALTDIQNAGWDASARWPVLLSRAPKIESSLASLGLDDRYRFVAWLILGLDSAESFQIAPLAAFLHRSGITDLKRLNDWADELEGVVDFPGELRPLRLRLVGDLTDELRSVVREGQEIKKPKLPR